MTAKVNAAYNPMPEISVTWKNPHYGEMSYHEILNPATGKLSVPGLGLTPPLIYYKCVSRRPSDVALELWERDGRPQSAHYNLLDPHVCPSCGETYHDGPVCTCGLTRCNS